jgi:hypothetical protein
MQAQDLTTAKTVAKISAVGSTAGGKKNVARRSTGLDYLFLGCRTRSAMPTIDSVSTHKDSVPARKTGQIGLTVAR